MTDRDQHQGDDRHHAEDVPELVELLDEANFTDFRKDIDSGSWAHDVVAAQMAEVARASRGSGRFNFELGDSLGTVTDWVFGRTSRPLGQGATWVRFVDPVRGVGLLAVVHSPITLPGGEGEGEADLIVLAEPGMFTPGLIRDICRWAFHGIGLRRVVARIPEAVPAVSDLARRAGFEHEGRARDFFGPGLDASVWSMTTSRCRWLPHARPAIPTVDVSPPSSLKVH